MKLKRIAANNWWIPIGKSYYHKMLYFPLHKIPHLKVAGVTGSGKSQFLRWLMLYYLQTKSAKNVKFIVGDFKEGATFSVFRWWPNVEVYKRQGEFLKALETVNEEMNRRLEEIEYCRMWFKEIPQYQRIIVIIDEGSQLSPSLAVTNVQKSIRNACHDFISDIARIGREPLVNLVFATQRPDKDSLPPNYRGQLEGTFCFRTQNDYDSEIILRHKGAEKLPWIPGRFIYQVPLSKETQAQAPFVSDDVLRACVSRFMTTWSMDNGETGIGTVSGLSGIDKSDEEW